MEWVCRQHDARRSATTRPTSGGEERAATDYALPPEESSMQTGSDELDLEALIREACELVKVKIEAEREWYIGTMGEGAEQATLSTCGERTTMDEAGN